MTNRTGTYTLHRRQFIAAPRAEVFAFFSRPENLALLTPQDLGFRILTPSPVRMEGGALIDYTIRILGAGIRWTTLVTEYEAPHRFVDVQLRGPYAYWHHAHEFTAIEGGTEMTDTVTYAMPLGVLGSVAHALLVRRKLEAIFDFRRERVRMHW